MFRDVPKYAETTSNSFWSTRTPAHWAVRPGLAVLQENRRKNTGLTETQVLSLSYGRVVVKPLEKQHGLVPDSYEGYQILEPGDIVVRPTDLQNDQTSVRVGHVYDHGIITSAYIGLRPAGDWDGTYAYQYLRAVDSTKRIYGMGSGLRQQLGWADLKRMPCLVPPIEEQAAIVKYLAHANARIGKAIAARIRLISLLEEQARETVNRVVTKGLDRNVPFVDSGVPWIGLLPEHWSLVPARSIFKPVSRVVTGSELPQLSLTRSAGLVPSGAPGSGTIAAESSDNLQQCNRGDFVLNKYRAHMGLFRWCRTPGMVTRNYTVLKPNSLVYHDYFENLFLDPVFAEGLRINARGVGDGMSPLYTSTLMSMKMPLPPIEEQQAIVGLIIADTARLNQRIALTSREIQLLQEFRNRLVADVVTGQIDVRAIAASLPDAPEQDTELDSLLDDDLEGVLNEGEE